MPRENIKSTEEDAIFIHQDKFIQMSYGHDTNSTMQLLRALLTGMQ